MGQLLPRNCRTKLGNCLGGELIWRVLFRVELCGWEFPEEFSSHVVLFYGVVLSIDESENHTKMSHFFKQPTTYFFGQLFSEIVLLSFL